MTRHTMRIDLFVSPGCPACPTARAVVDRFTHDHPGVEVREWDLTRDPGPALGRGIFATPTLLLDGVHILPGVPSLTDLEQHAVELRTTRISSPSKGLDASSQ